MIPGVRGLVNQTMMRTTILAQDVAGKHAAASRILRLSRMKGHVGFSKQQVHTVKHAIVDDWIVGLQGSGSDMR